MFASNETTSDMTGNYIGWTSPGHSTEVTDLMALAHLDAYLE